MPSLRRSAAVLLTRGAHDALELYLVERARELATFGGYWALPGGVADASDALAGDASDEAALERCALRELFEETGVLVPLLDRALARGERERVRAELLAVPAGTAAWRALAPELEIARRRLRLVCRVTTPPFGARRYQNVFLHVELPRGEQPRIEPGELVRGRFVAPRAALDAWRAGELALVPPVLALLESLTEHGLAGAFERAARAAAELEAGALHPVRFSPGIALAPLRTPTLPPATTTNCALVGEERVYVIDPATYEESERARLFDALDRWIAAGRRIEAVLATHHHADHVGSIEATARRYGVPVLAHRGTLARLSLAGVRASELRDGDVLELGSAPDGRPDWRLRVLHTPGHAPGHLAFVEDRYRAAVVGDLASTLSTIVIDPEDGHLATYLASLRRLLGEDIGTLHPAHGPAVRDGAGLLRRYLAHRAAREAVLVEALREGLSGIEELVSRVYADTAVEIHALAARSLLAGLIKLEEEGRVERTSRGWRPCA